MTANSKRSRGASWHSTEQIAVALVAAAAAAVVAIVWGAFQLGADGQRVAGNPFTLARQVADGTVQWRPATTVAAVVIVAVVALVATVAALVWRRASAHRTRVDRAGRKMGRGSELRALSHKGASETATRLGVDAPGLMIARTVQGDRPLYAGWEDVSVDISGPRTGKTTSRAIPAILDAPGAVVATSNKRDLVDATRDPRSQEGEVWVFDPQGIVDEQATWWWNPLSYVTDEVKASILADVFASSARDPGARTDAYFEPAGQELLANLLLAAAKGERALGQVYLWLSNPNDDEPVQLLEQHGFPLLAAALQAVVSAPEKQRGGVYGTAQQTASFMTNREAMRWVTETEVARPAEGENRWVNASHRREFDPAEFVRSTQTLYSVSKEGRGSAGALVAALTLAVTEAAEERAKRSPQGRLPVPMVVVADEICNVCRLREMPNLYSHYGSRGICVMAIMQSWSQGVEVWGREGMRKLWSAANIKVYGGGVAEVEFLQELSTLIGDFDLDTLGVTHGKGGRSVNYSTRRERVLEVSELAALPRGRALVFASGAPPALVRTVPWMDGPHAEQVRASVRAHDPAAVATIDAADPDRAVAG